MEIVLILINRFRKGEKKELFFNCRWHFVGSSCIVQLAFCLCWWACIVFCFSVPTECNRWRLRLLCCFICNSQQGHSLPRTQTRGLYTFLGEQTQQNNSYYIFMNACKWFINCFDNNSTNTNTIFNGHSALRWRRWRARWCDLMSVRHHSPVARSTSLFVHVIMYIFAWYCSLFLVCLFCSPIVCGPLRMYCTIKWANIVDIFAVWNESQEEKVIFKFALPRQRPIVLAVYSSATVRQKKYCNPQQTIIQSIVNTIDNAVAKKLRQLPVQPAIIAKQAVQSSHAMLSADTPPHMNIRFICHNKKWIAISVYALNALMQYEPSHSQAGLVHLIAWCCCVMQISLAWS